jgi:hypothetical protein
MRTFGETSQVPPSQFFVPETDLVVAHRQKDIQVWFTRTSAIILCGEDRGVVVREQSQVREKYHAVEEQRQLKDYAGGMTAIEHLTGACHGLGACCARVAAYFLRQLAWSKCSARSRQLDQDCI